MNKAQKRISEQTIQYRHEQCKKLVKKSISTYYKKNIHATAYLAQYQLYQEENNIVHCPYFIEQQMLTAITAGDKETYHKITKSFFNYDLGQFSDSPTKSMEYMAVTFLSLVLRAAIEGGIDPILGYNLGDLFLQQIAQCNSSDDYLFIIDYLADTYMDEVIRSKKIINEPIPVKKAKSYISRNLTRKMSLDEIATEACVDKSYLIRLFKRYLGMTVTTYINHLRINAAAEMLTYSDVSIGQIAAYFCFASQSNFSSLFKRYKNMNPSEYRQINYQMIKNEPH